MPATNPSKANILSPVSVCCNWHQDQHRDAKKKKSENPPLSRTIHIQFLRSTVTERSSHMHHRKKGRGNQTPSPSTGFSVSLPVPGIYLRRYENIRIYYKLWNLCTVDKIAYIWLLCNKHEHTRNSHSDWVHLELSESQKRQLILVTSQRTDRVF